MGFLAPLFLIAGTLVAVPIVLHLFQRQETRRIAFPAVRYLFKTEKEHARRIRLRQLILLLLRVGAVVFLTLIGARVFVRAQGGAHDPTALAIVVDNSMSSGVVVDDTRMLDRLKEAARASVREAGPGDRIWVLAAGEPWAIAEPVPAQAASARIDAIEVSDGPGDLGAALRRAAELLGPAADDPTIEATEIQLFTDLQATGLPEITIREWIVDHPLLIFAPEETVPRNHGLVNGLVGGGLPPVVNQRTEFTVRLQGSPEDTVAVRLVVEDRIRAASTTAAGGSALLQGGPFPQGWVTGYLESDRDALLADDRYPFAFLVEPPPIVRVRGATSLFLESALAVLEEEGRARADVGASPTGLGSVLFAIGGEGIESPVGGRSVLVVPPGDPALLPAVNRRLADAEVPWRYRASENFAERRIADSRLPIAWDDVEVRYRYVLVPEESGTPLGDVRVRLDDGSPWIVTGEALGQAYLLLGSPLDPESSDLPVSAGMIPFLQWAIGPWSASSPTSAGIPAGAPLSLPPGATTVVLPDGTSRGVDGTRLHLDTGAVGIYTVMADESVLEYVAVVPPASESDLLRADERRVEDAFGDDVRIVDRVSRWENEIFRARRGPELWRPLLFALVILLLLESWIASTGRTAVGDSATIRPRPSPRS